MIELPDFNKAWDFENNFYLSCDPSRLAKMLAHYEIYKMTVGLPGAFVECGVFKGISLTRFATFRNFLQPGARQKIVGFDIFGKFPETSFAADIPHRKKFIDSAGSESIDPNQLRSILERKGISSDVELVAGDICQTVPEYVRKNPDLKISLLNLDTDIFEPAVTILENFFPRIVPGGILMLDDYNSFPGETQAVDEYFKGKPYKIERLPFAKSPAFIRKV